MDDTLTSSLCYEQSCTHQYGTETSLLGNYNRTCFALGPTRYPCIAIPFNHQLCLAKGQSQRADKAWRRARKRCEKWHLQCLWTPHQLLAVIRFTTLQCCLSYWEKAFQHPFQRWSRRHWLWPRWLTASLGWQLWLPRSPSHSWHSTQHDVSNCHCS